MYPEDLLADRYRLRRRLASGGMGEVWLADDAILGREVALKVLTVGSDALMPLIPSWADGSALVPVKGRRAKARPDRSPRGLRTAADCHRLGADAGRRSVSASAERP